MIKNLLKPCIVFVATLGIVQPAISQEQNPELRKEEIEAIDSLVNEVGIEEAARVMSKLDQSQSSVTKDSSQQRLSCPTSVLAYCEKITNCSKNGQETIRQKLFETCQRAGQQANGNLCAIKFTCPDGSKEITCRAGASPCPPPNDLTKYILQIVNGVTQLCIQIGCTGVFGSNSCPIPSGTATPTPTASPASTRVTDPDGDGPGDGTDRTDSVEIDIYSNN